MTVATSLTDWQGRLAWGRSETTAARHQAPSLSAPSVGTKTWRLRTGTPNPLRFCAR